MNIWNRVAGWFGLEATARNPLDDFWYTPLAPASASGVAVNADTALMHSAVYGCVKVLAETLGSLPLAIFERLGDGGKRRAYGHPLYELLHDAPNGWMTSQEWRELAMVHVLLRGNHYSLIEPGRRGAVDQLIPVPNPDWVTPELLPNHRMRYTLRDPRQGGGPVVYAQEQVFHLRGLSLDGVAGLSVIRYAREAIGLGLAMEQFGARLFSQGIRPSGVLEYPGKLSDQGYARLRQSWREQHAGLDNAHKPAILEEGMKFHPLSIAPEDAQFLESRRFSVNDICRWFRVPPHMVADLDRATFSNIEQQSLEFVTYTMLPWFTRWEAAIQRDLMTAAHKYFAEFVADGLLRGDAAARYAVYAIARNWGIMNVDEIRAKENLSPLPDGTGQVYLQPLNMVEAGSPPAPGQAGRMAVLAENRNGVHAHAS